MSTDEQRLPVLHRPTEAEGREEGDVTATPTDHAAAFSATGTHDARVAALRRLPARQRVLLAADWAETVLPVWEGAYPADDRPRRAIEAARKGDGKAFAYAAYAAYAATYAAADAAAHAADAAAHAAYAAAYVAADHATYAAYAAYAATYAATAYTDAAYAAAASVAADAAYAGSTWDGVRRLWESAHNTGHVWRPEWRTPLAVEMARDPAAYPVLLDLLADEGVPVEGLRGMSWSRSNWVIYHMTEGKL